jgi:hypothetical protein
MDRKHIIEALRKFIAGRSGIDFHNYADRESAMDDYRKILRHGKDARAMLRVVELSSMTAEELLAGFRAYSGRLTYTEGKGCDYTTGQYYATEYRAAACAVIANAIGQAVMDDFNQAKALNGLTSGTAREHLLRYAKRNLGRAITGRWFA